jgi:hypothetical protein
VDQVERYRQFAVDCLKMASQTEIEEHKTMLGAMAATWLRLARERTTTLADGVKHQRPGALDRS